MEPEYTWSPRTRRLLTHLAVALVVAGMSVGLTLLVTNDGSTTVATVKNLDFGVVDTFRRADSGTSLGQADSGQRWVAHAGTWGVSNGEAYVASPTPGHANLAVINTHTGDETVQVTTNRIVEGAGLVFRYQNDFNYWSVVAAPSFATWVVHRVGNGKVTSFGDLGLLPPKAQTTVSVQLRGREMDFAINGSVRKVLINDPFTSLVNAPWVGLTGPGDVFAPSARWTNFVATGAAPPGTRPPAATRSRATGPLAPLR